MLKQTQIYADYLSTTPVDKRVFDMMSPYFCWQFGNPASKTHSYGNEAAIAVEKARKQVADLLGAQSREIIFTSGATEANNLAIRGIAKRAGSGHIVTSMTEHKAVLEVCSELEQSGFEVTYLPVDAFGNIQLGDLDRAIKANTILVSVMHSNNEIGTIHPVEQIGSLCKQRRVIFHCDAAQSVGKVPLNVRLSDIDLLSFSGHKLYGPKGVGVLYVRSRGPRVRLLPQICGGGQEKGIRAGTLNVPSIVGIGAACKLAGDLLVDECSRLLELRKHLWNRLEKTLNGLHITGSTGRRLPGHLSFFIPGINVSNLLEKMPDIALSTGAACSSDGETGSHVLEAVGYNKDKVLGSLRIGLGRFSTREEIDCIADRIIKSVLDLNLEHSPH